MVIKTICDTRTVGRVGCVFPRCRLGFGAFRSNTQGHLSKSALVPKAHAAGGAATLAAAAAVPAALTPFASAASCSSLLPLAAVSVSSGAGAVLGLSASWLFGATSALMVPVYAVMAFFTDSKLSRSALLNSGALYIGLALLYAATLVAAWGAGLGSVLGALASSARAAVEAGSLASLDLSPVADLFSQPLGTLLTWLHLLTLDAVMAREIALDGIRTGVATTHSVLLCFFFGPTGLLSHAITRLVQGRGRK